MKVVVAQGSAEAGAVAAEEVAALVSSSPDAVLGLATGSSPQGLYAELRARVAAGGLSFADVRGFGLDEYVGLPSQHPQSYAQVLRREVGEPMGFADVRVPAGTASDLALEAAEYDAAIAESGGIDLQILGIGANGHIGFNEPGSSFGSRTRTVALTDRTRADNSRFFDSLDEVPTRCVTQGIGTILEAGALLLIAHGRSKAEAVVAAVEGPVTELVPASALRLHPRATLVVDEDAASLLTDWFRQETTSAGD